MVEYFRTTARPSMLVRRLLQAAVALALFSILTSMPALAQNGAGRSNSAQAALHIRINIVPTLIAPPPPPEPNRPLLNAVNYNISTAKSNVETIEETRPLSDGTAGGRGAILKTLTIVPR
ncbi:MAG TPA: hypothetical protein VI685_03555 [Candidatus Angelobacter sp.]